ncbi:hypothetical protein OH799_33450 [Nocardia sp. NBC_00881]|uniref:hypothetical protein n=1 Tax=Nocardia sp. NBC_00881 TaxID=2975995 RepID=UPI003863F695|nr:hypothetical protein OH799_33450 [Nocardia sp. NBC_00881]
MTTSENNPTNLDEWLDSIGVIHVLLKDLLPDDVELDYSAESLPVLEAASFSVDEVDLFDDAVAAYVGQTLRRVACGR